ncbi:putative translation-associated element 2 [Leptomonas seymouri]|uniref:Putative translation-associated element 2 n=1 Tax=Leptomonas seymouri TaxID=5684 RepID=A0A0N0P2W4_LEPSE|nr:putative translation-associated element 2 [Leptomonas seymouri]|eukprot:KPI82967.1 putative translation-associated element 2 [Leptomonas seymouri]
MVKQRMTALDVRATVEEMRAHLIGLRLLNIYNISNKTFLFKFGHGENKRSVLLENGIRFHLTELAREKPKVPSQFTLKLRKHIRAWRLDSITQLQHDRTIDLCFGVASTEGCFHILIELFSKGNVILTDYSYKMMMLLRTHRDDEGLNLVVNAIYPVTAPFTGGQAAATGSATPATSTVSASVSASATAAEPHVMLYTPQVDAAGQLHVDSIADANLTPAQRRLKEERTRALKAEWDLGLSRGNERTLVQALVAGIQHLGPDLAQHVLTISGVPNTQQRNWKETPDMVFEKLLPGLLQACDLAKVDLTSAGGYLIKKKAKGSAESSATAATAPAPPTSSPEAGEPTQAAGPDMTVMVAVAEQYESFTPILLAQYTQDGVESIYRPSFGRVCDDFFLITETGRIDASNDKRKNAAKSKEDKFAADHARRINGLEADIAKNQQKGEQLILNADRVDEAIQLINGALATGISWDALRSLLKRRHAEGHPVAYMIHELFLERNAISVLLESTLEGDEEDGDVSPLVVEVALSKTAHANAADYFGKQKHNRSKLARTVASTDKAAAGAARKGARKAAEQKERKAIVKERQRCWWEKFMWFRTSAGDLVMRGKDVQSTELLLRRVKKLGDFFVLCEVDGSLPCLLRPMAQLWCNGGGVGAADAALSAAQPIAAASLCEAGAWCVALSGAWEAKQTTGAWWIYASQVTGGSAAGTYIFSGERHCLPPQSMSLGCALLFYVSRTVDQPATAAATITPTAPHRSDEGDENLQESGEAHCTSLSAEEVVRQELPRLPTVAQLKTAVTDAIGVGMPASDVIPADSATALADMPTMEALRADQRRQQQTYSGGMNTKGKGRSYARNARVDRSALQLGSVGGVSVIPSAATDARAPSTAAVSTTATVDTQQQQGKALSKYQKKKLRKIQDKYGDQDEEDRVLGAQVNGNQLSRVQLMELERLAALRQQEEEEKRRQAKAVRHAARVAGTLRYRAVAEGEDTGTQSEDESAEDVEVVSDFTVDTDEVHENNDAASNSVPMGSPSPPSPTADDLAEDSEEEELSTYAASPTDPSPREGENKEGRDGTDQDGSASQAQTGVPPVSATAARSSHDAVVAQQTAELYRAFPHYTMNPAPTDVVHHVVAVCAPMTVVSDYTYHVPLAMGNTKKGVLAGKLLQVFTERAERGWVTAAAATGAVARDNSGGSSRKNQRKAAKTHVDPSKSAAAAALAEGASAPVVNPSVVKALQMMNPTDIVEQLRANVKPVDFKI